MSLKFVSLPMSTVHVYVYLKNNSTIILEGPDELSTCSKYILIIFYPFLMRNLAALRNTYKQFPYQGYINTEEKFFFKGYEKTLNLANANTKMTQTN